MHAKVSLFWILALVVTTALCVVGFALYYSAREGNRLLTQQLEDAAAEQAALAVSAGNVKQDADALRRELEQQRADNEALKASLDQAETVIEEYQSKELNEEEQELIRQNHSMTVGYAKTSRVSKFAYWLYKPNLTEDNLGLPLVVYLHGTSGLGTDPNRILMDQSLSEALAEDRLCPNALVLIPQCPTRDWNGAALEDTMELIEQIAEEYAVDRRRISLSGASLGGMGCWNMLQIYGDYFSAVVPVGSAIVALGRLEDISKTVPIWAFQGTEDEVMGPSLEMAARTFEEEGYCFRLTLLQGENHSVQYVYTDPDYDILGWLISQRRPEI